MTQAAASAVPARKPVGAAAGSASAPAGPRLIKLVVAVLLTPLLLLVLTALFDLNFAGLVWNHPAASSGSGGSLGWRSITRALPGLVGLAGLGLTLGLAWKFLCAPERWLRKTAGRFCGAQEKAGGDGSFLSRWLLFQTPLVALLGLATQAVLRLAGQSAVADGVLAALPLCYGLHLAGLLDAVRWESELCKQDGFWFTWISSALMQVVWLAVGLVFFLRARPVWHFLLDWVQACVNRAVQWLKVI